MAKNSRAKKHWPETGLFPLKIVGTSNYHQNISTVAKNQDGEPAFVFYFGCLIQETDNPHDSNAVLVVIDSLPVGHLPKEKAKIFREVMAAKGMANEETTCSLLVRGGNKTSHMDFFYSIEADICLSDTPCELEPRYGRPVIKNGYPKFMRAGEGAGLIEIFLPAGLLDDMDKDRNINSWKSRDGSSINYYAQNGVGIGSGYWLFSIPTDEHVAIFGTEEALAEFKSISGRNAVVRLSAEV